MTLGYNSNFGPGLKGKERGEKRSDLIHLVTPNTLQKFKDIILFSEFISWNLFEKKYGAESVDY